MTGVVFKNPYMCSGADMCIVLMRNSSTSLYGKYGDVYCHHNVILAEMLDVHIEYACSV